MGSDRRPFAFICSPYRGNTERNVAYARELCRQARLEGYRPLCPHLYFTAWLDDDQDDERAEGIDEALEWLRRSIVVIVGTRYGVSEGMDREISEAKSAGKLIREVL